MTTETTSIPRNGVSFLKLYKRNALGGNRDWQLTDEETFKLFSGNCDYCGAPPEPDGECNGIDRVDNKRGYFTDNCVPACGVCNKMKGTLTKEEFLDQVRRIYEHQLLGRSR